MNLVPVNGSFKAVAFDPYYHWLGIPDHEQPPDRYRLLGIARFEPNEDMIDTAAARQMSHIRSFQNGPNVEASQQLMNELAEARIVLLDADKRREYDEWLASQEKPEANISSPAAAEDDFCGNLPQADIGLSPKRRTLPISPISAAIICLTIVIGVVASGLFYDDEPDKSGSPDSTNYVDGGDSADSTKPDEQAVPKEQQLPPLKIESEDVLVLYAFDQDEVHKQDEGTFLRDKGPHKILG